MTLSILAFTLSTVLGYLVFKGDLFAVKGGPNPDPHHSLCSKLLVVLAFLDTILLFVMYLNINIYLCA
jgi:hypothetical protein